MSNTVTETQSGACSDRCVTPKPRSNARNYPEMGVTLPNRCNGPTEIRQMQGADAAQVHMVVRFMLHAAPAKYGQIDERTQFGIPRCQSKLLEAGLQRFRHAFHSVFGANLVHVGRVTPKMWLNHTVGPCTGVTLSHLSPSEPSRAEFGEIQILGSTKSSSLTNGASRAQNLARIREAQLDASQAEFRVLEPGQACLSRCEAY
jgi:hypothetical protein